MRNRYTDFLLNASLYAKASIQKESITEFINMVSGKEKVSCFCPKCKCERVFKMEPLVAYSNQDGVLHSYNLGEELERVQYIYNQTARPVTIINKEIIEEVNDWYWYQDHNEESVRLLTFKYICSMDETHYMDFIVLSERDSIIKIGQYPSLADITFSKVDQYKKVLTNEDYKAIKRAVGLSASGIGIGAFVYLRRVLENLIIRTKDEAIRKGELTEDQFEKDKDGRQRRFEDKIMLLKNYLPPLLTANKKIYGVVSKGIHEMEEDECLKFFDVILNIILLILEEWETDRKKKSMEEDLTKSLTKLVTNISSES